MQEYNQVMDDEQSKYLLAILGGYLSLEDLLSNRGDFPDSDLRQ